MPAYYTETSIEVKNADAPIASPSMIAGRSRILVSSSFALRIALRLVVVFAHSRTDGVRERRV
jgi:hypothetical protein